MRSAIEQPVARASTSARYRTGGALLRLLLLSLGLLVVLSVGGCAAQRPAQRDRGDGAENKLLGARLSLPSLGISLPTPRGWACEPDRVGSIGSMLIATWLKPVSPGSELADARMVVVLVSPQAFGNKLPANVHAEPGPVIDGKPSLRFTPQLSSTRPQEGAAKIWGLSELLVEGYRLEAHHFHFYLLLESARPVERDRQTLREMVSGIRWSEPVPPDRALALSGQLTPVLHDAKLWFDLPWPFWNNPFRSSRGWFFSTESLSAHNGADCDMEVHDLGAGDIASARRAAVETPTYYETHGWDLSWREMSRDPEVHVGVSAPTPPDSEGTVWLVKIIVARAADGRYFRILFSIYGKEAETLKRYEALADDVARSVTIVPLPVVPHLREEGKQ